MPAYNHELNTNIQEILQRLSRLEIVVSEYKSVISSQNLQIQNLQEEVKQLRQICSPMVPLKQSDYQQIKITENCVAVALDRRTKDVQKVQITKGMIFGLLGHKTEQGWTEVISDQFPYKIIKVPTAYGYEIDVQAKSGHLSLSGVQSVKLADKTNNLHLQPQMQEQSALKLIQEQQQPSTVQQNGFPYLSQPAEQLSHKSNFYEQNLLKISPRPLSGIIESRPAPSAYVDALFEDSQGENGFNKQKNFLQPQNTVQEFSLLKQQPNGKREERVFYVQDGSLCWKSHGVNGKVGSLPLSQIETAELKEQRLTIKTVNRRFLVLHGHQAILDALKRAIQH